MSRGGTLLAWDLCLHELLDQSLELGLQESRHALLLAANASRELCGLAIADFLGERLKAGVQSDLDVLLAQLLLSVAKVGLGLLCQQRPGRPDLSLDRGYGLPRHLADRLGHRG